jgi:hypothetical protein
LPLIRIRTMKLADVVPLRIDAMSTHRNKWGYRGVEQVRPGRFRAVVGKRRGSNDAWRSKYFSTPAEAAQAYDTEARRRYGDLAYLNFPRPGERQVEPADENFCRHGHERRLHTHYGPDGRPACRECNRLARARSKARRSVARRKARTVSNA